jgi:hypothetical protein
MGYSTGALLPQIRHQASAGGCAGEPDPGTKVSDEAARVLIYQVRPVTLCKDDRFDPRIAVRTESFVSRFSPSREARKTENSPSIATLASTFSL